MEAKRVGIVGSSKWRKATATDHAKEIVERRVDMAVAGERT